MTDTFYTNEEVLSAALEYFGGDQLAANTWIKKYAKRDVEGNIVELTPDDMHKRLAKAFSHIEDKYRYKVKDKDNLKLSEYGYKRKELTYDDIYDLFKKFKYVIPAGSVMSGIENPAPVSLSNCWVIDGPTDSLDDIFRVCNEQSQLMKRRGGVGFDISKLRPEGASVNNSAKSSTGAASFMDLFSNVTNTIAQNGRRGALMLSINITHPDSEIFIEKKQDLTKVTGANVSVQIPDDFMKAVKNDETYLLRWPVHAVINEALTEKANGKSIWECEYGKLYKMVYGETIFDSHARVGYMKKVRAKDLWNKLIHCAWNTAEPGIIFQTNHHDYSPDGVYPNFRGSCTNPCVSKWTNVDIMINNEFMKVTIDELIQLYNYQQKLGNVGKDIFIKSYNLNTNEIEYKLLENVQRTKRTKDIIKVIFNKETNKHIICTPDHKIFTKNRGYVEAQHLTATDILVCENGNYKCEEIIKIDSSRDENILHKDCLISKEEFETTEGINVYDLTVSDNHNFFANDILIKNCGEIFMHEDSCRLIHVNLTSFVEEGKLNEEKLYEITYEAMRLGDDLVDLEVEAINRILKKIDNDGDKGNSEYELYERLLDHSLSGRRCGLGFTGLADTIAMLGMKYDSNESLKMIDHIMRIMFVAEMDSTIDMSITRGNFPGQDIQLESKGNRWYNTLKKDMPELYNKMMKYGRRNISFNTVAPTGTVSLMAQCSSGIEPIFLPYYTRRVKCMKASDKVDYIDNVGEKFTEYITVHPGLLKWAYIEYGDKINDWSTKEWQECYENSPWLGSTANDIDWEKRVKLQGIVQKYITHSISSTVNLPNNVSEEDVNIIYMKAWEDNLKGITVYRDGCRSGVMIAAEANNKPDDNVEVKRRPKTLPCKIVRFTNKGDKWVGVIGMLDGKPYEIFTGMQEKLNIPNWVEDGEIVRNKIDGESRYDICYVDKEGFKTCVEGLSRIFNPEYWNYGKLISGLLRHHMGIRYIIKVVSSLKLDDSINAWKTGIIRALRKFDDMQQEDIHDRCPECGGELIRDGGCIHCKDCGWSRCE